MSGLSDYTSWPTRLEQLIDSLKHFKDVHLLAETASTQDAALREGAMPGTIVLAGRQSSGRGQRGRSWEDDLGCGVAMTLVLPTEKSEALCARGAVAVARALVPMIEAQSVCAGIKWPNDLIAMLGVPKKIAGILVETSNDLALVGVGVNVLAREWPEGLADTAAALSDTGVQLARIDVIERLLREWDQVLNLSEEELRSQFVQFDVLSGAHARFEENGAIYEGVVQSVDPFGSVVLRTSQGVTRLNRACARLLSWNPRDLLSR